MSDDRHRADRESATGFETHASGMAGAGARPRGFGCWGYRTGDGVAECPCRPIMRRHPVISSVFLVLMGLACLLFVAGAVLRIITFFGMV